eukprot:174986_1
MFYDDELMDDDIFALIVLCVGVILFIYLLIGYIKYRQEWLCWPCKCVQDRNKVIKISKKNTAYPVDLQGALLSNDDVNHVIEDEESNARSNACKEGVEAVENTQDCAMDS